MFVYALLSDTSYVFNSQDHTICVCVHVCMYMSNVRISVCLYLSHHTLHVYMSTYTYIHTCIYTYSHTHAHISVQGMLAAKGLANRRPDHIDVPEGKVLEEVVPWSRYACIHGCVCMHIQYIHTYIHTYIHIDAHTYIHTHKHT
jgi:hypothetical protein